MGHKTADTSFFGYKTHLAMSEERIITAAVITTGEKNDGKQLQTLIEKSEESGIQIRYRKTNKINLVAKLNPSVTQGFHTKEEEFEFNKDAGTYVCKAGYHATRKARTGKKNTDINQVNTYYFDIEKCKRAHSKMVVIGKERKIRHIQFP